MQTLPAKTTGEIDIRYNVYCPHCGSRHTNTYDYEWFEDTMGVDFPIDNGHDQTFEATCKECKHEFEINGFQY